MSIKEFIILSKVLIKGLIPPGGKTGQIIKKKSEKNFDVEWGTGGSGGGDVSSVNDVLPDENGNVDITTDDIPEGTKKYLTGNEFNKVVDDMDDISDGTTYKKVSTTEKNTWNGKQDALGFTPENSENKKTTMTGNEASATVFLVAKAIYDWATGLFVQTTRTINSKALSSNITLKTSDISEETNLYFTNERAQSACPAETTTTIGTLLNGATEKGTLVDDDLILAANSEDSFKIVKEKYSNFKTNLVSYIASSALTVSGVFSFVKDKIALVGTSTGKTTLSTANTSASNYTQTFPAKTGTVANLDDNITGTSQGCDLASGKQIAYTVPTVDGTATGNVTSAFNCGYTSSTVGDVVYLDSSSTWQKADMNTSETTYSGLLAIALEVKASGNALKVALPGSMIYATGFPNLTVGGRVYLSDNGAITQTASTTNNDARRVLGHAIHADKIWFYPSNDYVVYQA